MLVYSRTRNLFTFSCTCKTKDSDLPKLLLRAVTKGGSECSVLPYTSHVREALSCLLRIAFGRCMCATNEQVGEVRGMNLDFELCDVKRVVVAMIGASLQGCKKSSQSPHSLAMIGQHWRNFAQVTTPVAIRAVE